MFQISKSFVDESCNSSGNTFYFSLFVSILLIILIIISLNNLEKSKCKCSDIPERKFLKEWFIFMIIAQSIFLFFFMIGDEPCYIRFINNYYLYYVALLIGIINFIMIIRLLIYIQILRTKCPCGYGNLEKFIFWYFIIIFSLIALLFTLLLLLGIIIYFMVSKKK